MSKPFAVVDQMLAAWHTLSVARSPPAPNTEKLRMSTKHASCVARAIRALAILISIGAAEARAVPLCQSERGEGDPFALVDDRTDDAVLSIDGEPISSREFGMWLIRTQGERMAKEYAESYFAVDREAKRLGVDVTPQEISQQVEADFAERIRGAFFGRKEDWLRELERTGRTESGVRAQRNTEYRPYLQAKAIANINRVVPEEKIVREWTRLYGRNGRQYDVLMIKFKVVVPTDPDATREEWLAEREARMKEQREKAEGVRKRLLAGEDFGKLAAQFSDDADTRANGGAPTDGFSHVGWFASFMDGLEKVPVGDISPPMYSRGGYWLVKVLSVHETPLEDVHDAIEAELVLKGPEPDEIGAVQSRLKEGVMVKVLPSMYSDRERGEWPSAFEPALEIDGETVPRGVYARWIRDTIGETFVPLFVEERAVQRKAGELGIAVSEAEVDERARDRIQFLIDSGHKGSRESWRTYLARSGRTEDSFLRDIVWRTRVDLLAEKIWMRERPVTPELLRQYFASEFGSDGRRVEVALIACVSKIEAAKPDWTREQLIEKAEAAFNAARERAHALAERARAGEDFAALARASSDDPTTRDQGGNVPGRFRGDTWNDEIAAKVLALDAGGITDPLEFGSAWFVFKVTQDRKVTFEEVEKELAEEVKTQRPSSAELAGFRNSLVKGIEYEILPGMSK